ncbi:MAG: RimK family alpha-L-glutamate ligase [Rhodanobacter sp.]|jgi:glutathione synthase/RimK-type ligase-like ATP-grasp enzyme|uniref:RimK family alpha-L-glutamate ligase n=1 Tax=Rhodanobacter glycinis TaxID=582702 RepID=A0A5B9DVB2_9GAMM|nr:MULTISPECIES: RimK family alpha-L-glutamate ligase [Rhodanobacter]EIL97582.1 glutathione synthase/ribosomal protein S6 modification protein [Rhodanobacter sp. 115]EIM03357.1 glutathione synthase/ribosomal protein S6 modification protein [Rhodanobacter sp. 115]QEE23139.1 RimK family alpha-L-glutamate ligase [Rhodanobacter glycinis]TAM23704.1 MAG: RimK family alpha-L-glutamate ligase [Rhodanobacter sp.]
MTRLVIVVEKASDWGSYYPSVDVVSAMDYLREPVGADDERTHVINLCRSYKYLGTGYYVSLLAEARGHRVMPSVRTINDLRRRSLYGLDIDDLNQKLTHFLPAGGRDTTDFGTLVYFGETAYPALQDLARQVFEMFPCPLLRIEFERERVWQVASIKPVGLHTLDDAQEDGFATALDSFSRKLWRKPRVRKRSRYDLAMLVDPAEQMPPSNRKALKSFVAAGRELGIEVDPIGKNDYQRLAEYDGLFIRETTASDNHTYRFAHRAEKEGMVVMDDPTSILRCTNKIFLNDLMVSRKLAVPHTEILYRDDSRGMKEVVERLGFPLVLKIPDGSFSRGVVKVEDEAALAAAASSLFQHSALLLAQEFVYTEFDWRIGVLNREALYACKYYMSRGHWQIYNHGAKGTAKSGGFETIPVRDAPTEVVKLALKATNAVGDGLYGVDLKQVNGKPVVIEVNDNPSIDAGVEDVYLGEDLYRRIMQEFLRRMERKRLGIGR